MTKKSYGIIDVDEKSIKVGSPEWKEYLKEPKTWESYFPAKEWLTEQIELSIKQNRGRRHFRPFVDQGWYFQRMLSCRGLLESGIKNGNMFTAVTEAVELGRLMTESSIKFEWESDALWGRERLNNSRDGAKTRRINSSENRVKAVDALVSQGKSKRNSFIIVAKREGSSHKTVEADYYKAKKRPKPIE